MERGVGDAGYGNGREATRGLLYELVSNRNNGEGLRCWRFCVVVSSFAPLFLLLAVRGNAVVPDIWMWTGCVALAVIPTALLFLRVWLVWKMQATLIRIGSSEDSRAHLLSYLFATMLPFYRSSLDAWRDLLALIVAIAVIVFLFWYLGLHYVNVILALLGYRVYRIIPHKNNSSFSRRMPLILITRRHYLVEGEHISAKRLSDTVYWEVTQ